MDSDSDDDNVHFGTPLEPLEEDNVAKRRPPALQDQTVRDSRGRQRFHGAFTGGFSAGFFNTVGSRDGFQPAAFVSSRAARVGRQPARPDDFMDDEDRGDHGIAPQRVQAKSEFQETPTGGVKRKHPQFDEGPIPGEPVLNQLIKPVRDTVGVRILKSMGWRPGQGIGPRVTRAEKRQQQKVYGCARPPGADSAAPASDSDSDSDSALREVLLAPDDAAAPLVRPKHDQLGLGYRGLDRRSVLGPQSADATLRYRDAKGKLAIRGQAFGVGAFEEEDADIYGTEDMSNYDFESAPEPTARRPAPSAADRLAQTLAGFRLPEGKRSARPRYPPPPLPPNFTPKHVARRSRFEPLAEERRGLERHRLSAGQRADMIGEQQTATAGADGVQQTPTAGADGVQQTPTAGADGVQQTAAAAATAPAGLVAGTPTRPAGQAAAAAPPGVKVAGTPTTPGGKPLVGTSSTPGSRQPPPAGSATAPQQTQTGGPPAGDAARLQEVHRLLAESPDTTGPTLKPFARDPEKQARYEQFLKLSAANRKDDYRLLLPASMTDWEREREMSEFNRSALMFRPLATSLADRFVSAGTSEQERPGPAGGASRAADDPASEAAKRKMFGMLTRRRQEWHPAPLLCRRFNVKNPYPHSSLVGTLGSGSGPSPAAFEADLRPASPAEPPPAQTASKTPPRLRWDDMLAEEAAQTGAAPAQPTPASGAPPAEAAQPAPSQKPPADLFKAIFDDSDTESESESPGTPPPHAAVTLSLRGASQAAVTPSFTDASQPAATPQPFPNTLQSPQLLPEASQPPPAGAPQRLPAASVGVGRSGTAPAGSPVGGDRAAAPARPTAASFFEQAPSAAAKRPGFSLFANVDLDELNSWRRGGAGGGQPERPADPAPPGRAESSDDEYGPRLPPRPPAGTAASSATNVESKGRDSEGEWREKSPSRRKKKKKHKKSDKKKKKNKKRGSDDSDSSDLDGSLLEKLKDVTKKKKKSSRR